MLFPVNFNLLEACIVNLKVAVVATGACSESQAGDKRLGMSPGQCTILPSPEIRDFIIYEYILRSIYKWQTQP